MIDENLRQKLKSTFQQVSNSSFQIISIFKGSRGLIVAATLLAAIGCTKKEESSSLNIQMPDWSALTEKHAASSGKFNALSGTTVTAITRVMINISGPGMPTAVRIWDLNEAPRQPGVIPKPPPEFSFDVPRGSDRLFQALVILENIDPNNSEGGGGAMTFLYGDILKPVVLPVDTVAISLQSQGTSQGVEGSLNGRYLTSSGGGPTGQVNMFYSPDGRPEMIVETTSIFSGFFNFFIPPVAKFSFKMAGSGLPLFEKVTATSFDGNLSTRILKIAVPLGYRNEGSGSATRRLMQPKMKIVGYFGPGASTQSVCFKSTASPLSDLFVNPASGDTTLVNWSPASSSPNDARILGGGVPFTDDACPSGSGDFGSGHLFVRTQSIDDGDSPVGLRGPFEEVSPTSQNFLSASFSGTSLNLNWKYLRPTIGDSVDGVGVFTKVFAATENSDLRWYDSAPCRNLTSLGFTEITRVAAGTAAAPVESYTLTGVDGQAYSSGRHVTVMCPYSNNGGYHNFALVHKSGSNNSQISATQLAVRRVGATVPSTMGAPAAVVQDACTPIVISSVDNFGNLAQKQSGSFNVQVSLANSTGLTQIYQFEDCVSPLTTPFNFNMYSTEKVLFVKMNSSATNASIVVTDTSGGPAPALAPATLHATRTSPVSATQVIARLPANVYRNQCFPIIFVRGAFAGGEFLPQAGPASSVLTLASQPSGLQLYADPNCEFTPATPMFTSAESTVVGLYATYTQLLSSITLTPSVSGLTAFPASATVLSPGLPVRAVLSLQQISAGTCMPTRFYSVDNFGRPTQVTGTRITDFTLQSTVPDTLSGFFSTPTCDNGTQILSVTIPGGDYRSGLIYFRWTNSITLTVNPGSGSSLPMMGPATINVSP